MTKRIDHVAESEKIYEHTGEYFIAEQGLTEATALMEIINSVRHATLALVEQQRIANVLRLAGDTHGDIFDGLDDLLPEPALRDLKTALGL